MRKIGKKRKLTSNSSKKAERRVISDKMILCDNSIISLAEEKEDFLLDDCPQLEYSDSESDSEEAADAVWKQSK